MTCPHCGSTTTTDTGACTACGRALALAVDGATSLPSIGDRTVLPDPARTTAGSLAPGAAGGAPGLAPGAQLGNRYEILATLGEGGFGAVYKARDRVLERTVALKMIHPTLAANPEVMERFKREILLASKITHKNVIRIHDLGEVGDLRFISMNYVEGRDLKQRIVSEGALAPAQAVPLLTQIAEALDAAHQSGVVHRDLKPQNVLVSDEGHVYIVDFGISRSVDHGKTMTEVGSVMGTVAYMSPEQARGDLVDHRSDIYSFGLIAYEVLTGQLPFDGSNVTASPLSALMRRVQEEVPRLDRTHKGLPPWLARIVARCLERDTAARYQSVRELLDDLNAEIASSAPRRIRVPKRVLWAAAAAVVLAGAAWLGLPRLLREEPGGAVAGPATSVALVPFRNATGDPALDWTRTGLPSLLRSQLEQSPALNIVGDERVLGVVDGLRLDDGNGLAPPALARISTVLGVERLVAADLFRTGSKFRLEAKLLSYGAGGEAQTAAFRVEGEGDDALFPMIDDLSRQLGDALGARQTVRRNAAELSTASVEALRLYTEGVASARGGGDTEAAERLQAALAIDPDFAMARAMLAEAYARLGRDREAITEAEVAASGLRDLSPYEATRIGAVRARLAADTDAALQSYRALTELAPRRPDAHLALGEFLEEIGDLKAALPELKRSVELDPSSPAARYTLGRVQAKLGNLGEAQQELKEALSLHVESGNDQGRASVLIGLGNVSRMNGKYDQALRYFDESLQVHTEVGDQRGVATALNNVATIQLDQGRLEEAIETQKRSLATYEELGDRNGIAAAWSNLGEIYNRASRPQDALEAFQSALDVIRDSGDEAGLARAFGNLGYIYTVLGKYNEAFFIQKDALAARRELGEPHDLIASLVDIGFLEQVQGRYDEALRYYAEGSELARKTGDKPPLVALSTNVAAIHFEQGRYAAALASAKEAVAGARDLGDEGLLVPCLADLGQVLAAVGDANGAAAAFDEGLGLVQDMGGNAALQATLQTNRAAALLAQERAAEAATAIAAARNAASISKDVRLELQASLRAAEHAGSTKDLERIADDAEARRLKPLEAEARLGLARASLARGDAAAALAQADACIAEATPLGRRDILFQAQTVAAAAAVRRGDKGRALERTLAALEHLEELRKTLPESGAASFLAQRRVRLFAETAERALDAPGGAEAASRLAAALQSGT